MRTRESTMPLKTPRKTEMKSARGAAKKPAFLDMERSIRVHTKLDIEDIPLIEKINQ